jgi:hypothetical protein
MLLGASATNGLFLVRQSERSETDFALSFSYNKRCYHNRIMQDATGIFKNTKGTSWGSLSLMVADYGSPHEDMQVRPTPPSSRARPVLSMCLLYLHRQSSPSTSATSPLAQTRRGRHLT